MAVPLPDVRRERRTSTVVIDARETLQRADAQVFGPLALGATTTPEKDANGYARATGTPRGQPPMGVHCPASPHASLGRSGGRSFSRTAYEP